jgi:N-acetyl-alpha-D-muramate 1-phosphate uridylyltransferase
MRAMILAAGRGTRMGELTKHTPKPLLQVNGSYLIEYNLRHLARAGIKEVVINVCYLAEQIMAALGNGERYGLSIQYSIEQERLETGGGIYQALPFFANEPFLVVSADIICDFPYARLMRPLSNLAHLVLIANDHYHLDFNLDHELVTMAGSPRYTYAGIGVYHPDIFKNCTPGVFPISQVLTPAIKAKRVSGECYQGLWHNIGTAQELSQMAICPIIN